MAKTKKATPTNGLTDTKITEITTNLIEGELKDAKGDQVVDVGIGVIAAGFFRLSQESYTAAQEEAESVASFIKMLADNFGQMAKMEEAVGRDAFRAAISAFEGEIQKAAAPSKKGSKAKSSEVAN